MTTYKKTGDILVVKKKLRHADIKTTMVYADAENKDVADSIR